MPYASMEKYVSSQFKYWEKKKEQIEAKTEQKNPLPFITISREYGCSGYEFASELIAAINSEFDAHPVWAAYDRKLLEKIMEDMGLSESLAQTLTSNARKHMTNLLQTSFSDFPPQVAVYRKLVETIRLLAINGNVVIVGRAGNKITRDMKSGYHIRLVAPSEWRINNLKEKYELSRKDAEKLIHEKTKSREGFIHEFVKFDITSSYNYHLVLNMGNNTIPEMVQVVLNGIKAKGYLS